MTKGKQTPNPLLNSLETARLLGVSYPCLANNLTGKALQPVPNEITGRGYCFRMSDVLELGAKRRTNSSLYRNAVLSVAEEKKIAKELLRHKTRIFTEALYA
jgi:hypothetical protein